MDARLVRSNDVTSTLTAPLTAAPQTSTKLDFDALYRGCRDDLYAYVATLMRDRQAAEDVTALAFERAYRKQRSYDSRKAPPRAWLFGIARNAALDELRRRGRIAPLEAEVAADEAGPEDLAESALQRASLKAALGALAPRERELIGLKFHAGLDNAEIAAVLGVSVSNAGTLLHRAITKLRKAIHENA